LTGLYVILDKQAAGSRPLLDVLRAAADAGARLFQFRGKRSSAYDLFHEAVRLRDEAAARGVTLIVNDRCDLALAVEADGVHLGQRDLPLPMARTLLGAGKLIGVSTHSAEQVRRATSEGADYLGFGPIFGTATKSDHEPIVGVAGLREVRKLTALPLFAIGGISPANAAEAIKAGADGLAVISAVVSAAEVAEAVRRFSALIEASGAPRS
jgi:thiamine-phosphate pyrophosphorylase